MKRSDVVQKRAERAYIVESNPQKRDRLTLHWVNLENSSCKTKGCLRTEG